MATAFIRRFWPGKLDEHIVNVISIIATLNDYITKVKMTEMYFSHHL